MYFNFQFYIPKVQFKSFNIKNKTEIGYRVFKEFLIENSQIKLEGNSEEMWFAAPHIQRKEIYIYLNQTKCNRISEVDEKIKCIHDHKTIIVSKTAIPFSTDQNNLYIQRTKLKAGFYKGIRS